MSVPIFQDYRCTCGKLLLKGCVFNGLVEVKCKRCSKIMSWGQTEPVPCAVIDTDTNERITRVSGDIDAVLGKSAAYVVGRRAPEVLAHLMRSISPSGRDGVRRPYEIPDNHLVLNDGERRPVRTCTVPRRERGIFAGYRIFLVPRAEEN